MRKRILKRLALALAVIMVITTSNPSALVATAASMEATATGYETTYSIDELSPAGGYGFTVAAAEDGTEFAFATQYQEARFTVPAEVLSAGLTGFRANVSGDNGGWLSLKAQDSNSTQLAVDYGNCVLMCDDANFSQIALMNLNEEEETFVISSITFFTNNATDEAGAEEPAPETPETEEPAPETPETEEPAPETPGTEEPEVPGTEEPAPETPAVEEKAVEFGLADVKLHHRWDGSVSTEGGVLKFPSQYYEFVADLPAEYDLAGVESVTVKFADVTENLCIKLYDTTATANSDLDSTTPAFYGNTGKAEYTVTPNGGTLAAVGIMSMDADADFESTFTGISIKLKEGYVPAPQEEKLVDVLYTKNLSFVNRWDASKVKDANITFSGQYEEYVLTLDEALEISKCRSLKVNVSGQENEICVKIYDEDMNELKPYYGLIGSTEYTLDLAGLSGKIAKVAVMSLPAVAEGVYPYGVKIEGIEAKMVAGSATPRNDKAVVIADGMKLVNRWNSGDRSGNDITFNSQYHEYVYTLSEAIPTSLIDSVVVKVKDQQNQIAIKMYNELEEEAFVDYDVVGQDEYVFTPKFEEELTKFGFMSMAAAGEDVYPFGITIESVTINLNGAKKPAAANEEVIELTGDKLNFVEHWEGGDPVGATVTFTKQWDEYVIEIGKELNMERCKSISVKVKDQGNTVSYKVYSADDKELQPYYGKNGNTTISPSCDGIATKFAVMGSAEPNEGVYPYSITIESVTFVMDTTPVEEVVEKGVEYDLRDFEEAVRAYIGEDFIVGTAISYQEFADSMEMDIVTKHFNAVTLGNELKPDSMLKANAAITQVELNGEMVDFPVLDFSNAERYLNYFVEWNKNHPEKPIKIRGHVLVWHSQTPEFFFHEGYNASKALVSPEEMLKREEIYIRSVAEHFTSEGSIYKDLFYGWDVVNEAVSDSTQTYRNENENSSWWRVFKSPAFINNAFVYANKYFPETIELYYNDYNDTSEGKMKGIVALLKGVKATEGARIDAMGMQGHYQIQNNNPTVEQFETAAKTYCQIVGKVQVTELDFNQSYREKDSRLTERYLSIFTSAKKLRDEGYNVAGITIWGVVDKHSWLQTQNNVGGGSTNNNKKYPLLFDNNYKAKEAYYAIVALAPEKPEEPVVTVKNGVYEENGVKFLYINDVKVSAAGLYEVNGEIYHTVSNGSVRGGEIYVKSTNTVGLPYGNYLFDENGCKSHFTGLVEREDGTYFYRDGYRATFGLVEFEGAYYYVSSYGKIVTDRDQYVKITNGFVEEDSYLFDEDGKLSSFTGVKNNYYYTNGRRVEAGLVEFEGNFYYVKKHGVLAIGDVYVKNTNGLMEYGYYWFNTDGTMSDITGFRMINGAKYYYENGFRPACGLIEVDGELYYIGTFGKVMTGVVYVHKPNGLVSTKGHYFFDEDGKMIR